MSNFDKQMSRCLKQWEDKAGLGLFPHQRIPALTLPAQIPMQFPTMLLASACVHQTYETTQRF
jgi:hypothetical protein